MKRGIFTFLAILIFFWAVLWTLVTLFALIDPEETSYDPFYFLGGSSIIGFVISWLLFKNSRQK